MQVYHVQNDNVTTAYSFCKQCAVHIVNASDSDESAVAFNTACLYPAYIPTAPIKEKKERASVDQDESVAENDIATPDVRPRPKQLAFTNDSTKEDSIANDAWRWQALTKEPTTPPSEIPETPEGFQNPVEWPHETESTISGSTTTLMDAISTTASSLDETRYTVSGSLDDTTTTASDPVVARNQLRQYMKKHMKSKTPPPEEALQEHEECTLNVSID